MDSQANPTPLILFELLGNNPAIEELLGKERNLPTWLLYNWVGVEKVWGDIPVVTGFWGGKDGFRETDIQEKEQKESQKQANPSTEWKGQSQKSSQVKKIQLEGLKLPKPQDVLQKRKTRVKIAKKVEIAFKLYNLRGPNCQLTLKPSFPPQNPVTTVSSMAEIVSKEAQKKSKAGICFKTPPSHNKHTCFYLYKEAQAASPRLRL
ncbi:hypothetical protein Tco_1405817 [Tanacetum coccineum]